MFYINAILIKHRIISFLITMFFIQKKFIMIHTED